MVDLNGKVALITGGSRGLGLAMTYGLAEAGADVVITSRNLTNCRKAAAEVVALGRRALAYSCHVGHWDEIEQLVVAAYEEFGRVDVLINNAGMSPVYPSLTEITEELWDSVFAVNAKGPFRLAALVGTRMVADGGGSIINVSSVGSIRPMPNIVPYAAAKSALNSLTESLAKALAPTVRVNTLMAGPFLTDISRHWDMEAFQRRLDTIYALRRPGRPEEVVGAALFLASEASSFTTGSVLRVDGGHA
jgi:NAD(P)-dependent dehydrogenase (short-subunit alcohol dehydrogenase family)